VQPAVQITNPPANSPPVKGLVTIQANVTDAIGSSNADFDLACGLAKQITRSNSGKEQFEYNRRFWEILFEGHRRPIRWEVFRQLDDRMARYYPLFHKFFPDSATRLRRREVLVEFLRKGEVDEAVRAFKKPYLEVVHRIMDHLKTEDAG
jgi:DNA-binding GntR family transcriptional regulator